MRFSRCPLPCGWAVVPFLGAVLGVAGCSSTTGTVKGKVYFQGSPLKGGRVTLVSSAGASQTVDIGKDGGYVFEGVPPGEAKISVETESLRRRAQAASITKDRLPPNAPNRPNASDAADRFVEIPGRYSKTETSGQTYTVKPGKQEHDIKLD